MGRAEKFEAYEMSGGVYNGRKLPKWRFNQVDMMEYIMQHLDEESLVRDQFME